MPYLSNDAFPFASSTLLKRALAVAFIVLTWAATGPIPSALADAATFGLTERADRYIVQTGSGLEFAISRHNGDVLSINYKGRECQAPHEKVQRYSHYASGLSGSSIVSAQTDPKGSWIKITADDQKDGVIQYYIAHAGENNLYMATYAQKLPSPGEMRFIVYLDRDVFTNVPIPSDIHRADHGVEGKDVFKNAATGATYSKFYGASPIIDRPMHGVTGNHIGCFMDMGNRERSSGGPFFRDIENQSTGKSAEFYNYMFSGHTQTEPFRPGLKGPYAMQFTDGKLPKPPDYAFLAKLNLKGYVPADQRGRITGRATGVPVGHRSTVALASPAAQYWTSPIADGSYTIDHVLPGAYTETLYDVELAVAKKAVTVQEGRITQSDIAATLLIPPAVFRIGTWDGTPGGFLNADKIANHHPSDSCMAPFKNGNFIIGRSRESDWPLGEWKDVNNDQRITFPLSADQTRTSLTFRMGVTLTYDNARPQIEVNADSPRAWKSALPAPSAQPTRSRGITRGTYRGNNHTFLFDIPPNALHNGTNTIDIHVESSTKGMGGFLSPNIVFDALDLVRTDDAAKAAVSVSDP